MSTDAPQGRIGYVVQGGGRGREIEDAKSEVCCGSCRSWFDGRSQACECGWQRPGFSKPIRTAQLNNHLYVQAGLRKP